MNYPVENVLIAFLLTAVAGLSTTFGALFILRRKTTNYRFLTTSLGFSAGVMIYVSFVEILQESFNTLQEAYGENTGGWVALASFFGGIALIAIIDQMIPDASNPHEVQSQDAIELAKDELHANYEHAKEGEPVNTADSEALADNPELMRTGLVTALAIAIHNFPEGLATFMAALVNPALGVSITIAIAIHNIPEGISVAVPIYFASGSRRKAIGYTFLSGLAEPLGGLVGFLVLSPFLSPQLLGIVFGIVAGIMVFISFDELLPASEKYGEHHYSIMGLVAGMLVMAVSLQLLA